jgi:phosphoenolpyruvate carboxykinase (ATP)
MMEILQTHPDLEKLGFSNLRQVYWQLHTPQLYEESLRRQEGYIAHMGALVVRTGDQTGRSPKDKFVVDEPSTTDHIWWGPVNQKFTQEKFDAIHGRMMAYFQGRNVFVQNLYAGADREHRLPVRIITEMAWHSFFARNMFLIPRDEEAEGLRKFAPGFTVIHAPNFHALPEEDGTRSSIFIILSFEKRLILIGGTQYTGEIKKSIFTVMNYLMPRKGVLSMHCSANEGADGSTALFFGLSGTGKTTLSADPTRTLIGDDEHGWDDKGIFNFEGGCYAKVIRLSPTGEPEIFQATRMFGTILENTVMDTNTRRVNLDDDSLTENTRGSFPLRYIPAAKPDGVGGHPKNVIFLTADAFGVLPPVAKLTSEQAMYHFLSGYTAKVAGTERGLGSEPQATFSTCFGAPFWPLHPKVYADLLGQKVAKHGSAVWLVNTGWTGGPYGVGSRMKLAHTRAMVHAILDGSLNDVKTRTEPFFGLHVPVEIPGVPADILDARSTWADKDAYDKKAKELAGLFIENFKTYAADVSPEVVKAGPPQA